MEEAQMQKRIK